MKKRYILTVLLCLMLAALALFAACNNNKDFFDDYDIPAPEQETPLEIDEGIVLDGVLDEAIWQTAENNAYTFTSKFSDDVTMTSMCYLTEKGAYIGISVKDYAVYYNPARSAAYNSSAEIYFAAINGEDNVFYNIRVVPTGEGTALDKNANVSWIYDKRLGGNNWYRWNLKWTGGARVLGNLNTNTCEGFDAEVFLPWTTIGADYSGYFVYMPAFNHVQTDSVSDSERTWTGMPGGDIIRVPTWRVVSNQGVHKQNDVLDELIVKDSHMTIDGVLDESVWTSSTPVEFFTTTKHGDDFALSAKSYLTDLGVYLGIEVKDKYIYYNESRAVSLNSGAELFFTPLGATSIDASCVQVRITATGATQRYKGNPATFYPWTETYVRVLSATHVDGTLNAEDVSDNTGYTLELFLPWSAFGLQERQDGILFAAAVYHFEDADPAPDKAAYIASHPYYQYIHLNQMLVDRQHDPSASYATMTENGAVYNVFGAPAIHFDPNGLHGDHYEVEYATEVSASTTFDKITTTRKKVAATLALPQGVEAVLGEDNVYTLKIAAADVDNFLQSKPYSVTYAGKTLTSTLVYDPIAVDGEKDAGYNKKFTKVVPGANVAQTSYVTFGEAGLYLFVEVTDGRVRDDCHLETFIITGEAAEIGKSVSVRTYPVSTTYTYRTYLHRTPSADGFGWDEKTGAAALPMTVVAKVTEKGYNAELFIPWSTLSLDGAPEKINILTTVAYYASDTATGMQYRDGAVGAGNTYVYNIANFIAYDENGYISQSFGVDDVVISGKDKIDGNYVKTFAATDDQGNVLSGLKIVTSALTAITTENADGSFTITLPQSALDDWKDGKSVNAVLNGEVVRFTVHFFDVESNVVHVDYDGGTLVNSGTDSTVTVAGKKLDSSKNFVAADTVEYTEGMDGGANGAINTNNRDGAYTVVSGLNLGSDDFTVSVWIKIEAGMSMSTGNSTYLFGNMKIDGPTTNGFRWTIRYNSGGNGKYEIQYRVMNNGSTNKDYAFVRDQWFNFTVVRKGDALSFYVNGQEIGSQNCGENDDYGTRDIAFGAYTGETWNFNNGYVAYDQLRIYKKALSQEELALVMEADAA